MVDASGAFHAGGEIHHVMQILSDPILFAPGFAGTLETGQNTPRSVGVDTRVLVEISQFLKCAPIQMPGFRSALASATHGSVGFGAECNIPTIGREPRSHAGAAVNRMITFPTGQMARTLPLQDSPGHLDFPSKNFKPGELNVHGAPNGYDGENGCIRDGGILENYGLFLGNNGFCLATNRCLRFATLTSAATISMIWRGQHLPRLASGM
jgi:hypothetical protein